MVSFQDYLSVINKYKKCLWIQDLQNCKLYSILYIVFNTTFLIIANLISKRTPFIWK